MERINHMLDRLSSPQDSAQASERQQREKLRENANLRERGEIPTDHPIWDVWQAIKGFYPGVTVNWDAEPPLSWYATVGDLTAEQLGNGVRNLVHFHDDDGRVGFPPNAGQFRNLCLNSFDWEHRRQSKPAAEVLLEKPVDRGEGNLLPPPKDKRTVDQIRDDLRTLCGLSR